MSVDFRELEDFRNNVQQLSENGASEFCDTVTKELTARLLAKVVKRTPVGTAPKEFMGDDGKKKRKETVSVKGDSGKSRKMLSADAARYQQYWSGYVGGTLRRGWTAGQDINVKQYVDGRTVTRSGNVHVLNVINQVEYAPYVEYGHRQTPGRYVPALGKSLKQSWVKGQFMMTKSEAEIDAIAQPLVNRRLKEYLEKEMRK